MFANAAGSWSDHVPEARTMASGSSTLLTYSPVAMQEVVWGQEMARSVLFCDALELGVLATMLHVPPDSATMMVWS